jgi:7,8-dihydropterin-6-yl-methyl-4-(beta-D-ribofuranosyl)aminobenzene 5'-phosphate synthase
MEQSLLVETPNGLIVMTGCTHPGILEIAREAKHYGDVYQVVGGLHLFDKSVLEVETIIAELKHLGVRKIAPCHCTGDQAIEQIKAAFGAGFTLPTVPAAYPSRTRFRSPCDPGQV